MQQKHGTLCGSLRTEGGKNLKCKLELHNSIIVDIKLTGNFFIYPEEKIAELENLLKGMKFEKSKIRKVILEFCKQVTIIGFTAEELVRVIMDAK